MTELLGGELALGGRVLTSIAVILFFLKEASSANKEVQDVFKFFAVDYHGSDMRRRRWIREIEHHHRAYAAGIPLWSMAAAILYFAVIVFGTDGLASLMNEDPTSGASPAIDGLTYMLALAIAFQVRLYGLRAAHVRKRALRSCALINNRVE